MGKRDFKLGFFAAVLTAIFSLPILANLGFLNLFSAAAILISVPVFWLFGFLIIEKLAKFWSPLYQIFKFFVVGFLNTSLDFSILNLLSYFTGIYSGFYIIFLNSAAFLVAITNSYIWNKYWTFNQQGGVQGKEFLKFAAVGFIGFFLNNFLVYMITTFIPLFNGLTPQLLENLAKVLATAVSLIWNFIGYKFFVFRQ